MYPKLAHNTVRDFAPITPEQLGNYIKREITKWAPLVKESGLKPE